MINPSNPPGGLTHGFIPKSARITHIRTETPDVKTFRVTDANGGKPFTHLPGQCAMLGVPGVGEAMFSIASPPTDTDGFDFSIKSVGKLTNHLHGLPPDSPLTIRGPFGKPFPVNDALKGKNLIFIAGGIGIAPLRSVIKYVFGNRASYGTADIIYGARSAADLVYLNEIQNEWAREKNTRLHLTIDRPEEGWNGHVGFVPAQITVVFGDIFQAKTTDKNNFVVLVCGPPVMIKYSIEALLALGFTKPQIYTTLEMKMKCGVGQCGRCNIGHKYVCTDGPVFRADELDELPEEY
ncbi:MAG: FAD/NAD(P)-binding protein [Defluviitaleaceae bacterium]|nr:FAD/NAD(P)-binding protein [Defluviitaleaceae bacterium]